MDGKDGYKGRLETATIWFVFGWSGKFNLYCGKVREKSRNLNTDLCGNHAVLVPVPRLHCQYSFSEYYRCQFLFTALPVSSVFSQSYQYKLCFSRQYRGQFLFAALALPFTVLPIFTVLPVRVTTPSFYSFAVFLLGHLAQFHWTTLLSGSCVRTCSSPQRLTTPLC